MGDARGGDKEGGMGGSGFAPSFRREGGEGGERERGGFGRGRGAAPPSG